MSGIVKERRSWPLYARIMRELSAPQTAKEVADTLRLQSVTMHLLILRMQSLSLIHVHDWVMRGRGAMVSQWLAGAGVDATRPLCKTTGKSSRRFGAAVRPRVEMTTFAQLMAALSEPRTQQSIVEITGASITQVGGFLRQARRLRIIFIADWARRMHGGAPAPMYQFGFDQPDKARPHRMCRREVERRYRQGKRAKNQMLVVLRALAANGTEFRKAA